MVTSEEVGRIVDDLIAMEQAPPDDRRPIIVREARYQLVSLDVDRRILERWKAEATAVLDQWETVWEAAGKPGPLGRSKALNVVDELVRLRDDNTRLLATIDALNIELEALRPVAIDPTDTVTVQAWFDSDDSASWWFDDDPNPETEWASGRAAVVVPAAMWARHKQTVAASLTGRDELVELARLAEGDPALAQVCSGWIGETHTWRHPGTDDVCHQDSVCHRCGHARTDHPEVGP